LRSDCAPPLIFWRSPGERAASCLPARSTPKSAPNQSSYLQANVGDALDFFQTYRGGGGLGGGGGGAEPAYP